MIEDGYAICFNQWALDPRIKNEIQILLIISSLVAKTGVCFARNKYFADLFGEHEKGISRKIKKLADLGYIQITYTKRGCEVKERQIRVTKLLLDGPQNCYSTGNKIVEGNNNIFKNFISNWLSIRIPEISFNKTWIFNYITIITDYIFNNACCFICSC